MSRIAYAGLQRAHKTLGWQATLARLWCAPPQQSSDRSKIAAGVHPEWRGDSPRDGDDPTQGRADRAADIDTHAVCGHRLRQVLPGNQLGHDRLPRRGGQRRARLDEER